MRGGEAKFGVRAKNEIGGANAKSVDMGLFKFVSFVNRMYPLQKLTVTLCVYTMSHS